MLGLKHKHCLQGQAKWGAAKLQYHDFLRALMLVADKRRSGMKEVVDRIKKYGINVRQPSMADFLVMKDPGKLYTDSRDLERPKGLTPLKRSYGRQESVSCFKSTTRGSEVFYEMKLNVFLDTLIQKIYFYRLYK